MDSLLPPDDHWQGPVAWLGSPLRGVPGWREFPSDAVLVRAEVELVLSEVVSPGVTRQTERTLPGLVLLEKGKPVGVHGPGFTWRLSKRRWDLAGMDIEHAVVTSLVPMAGSRRHISVLIRGDGRSENLARAHDPDPRD